MSGWSRPLPASCLALFVLGCNAVFGIDELSFTSGQGIGGSEGATGGAGGSSSGGGGHGTGANGASGAAGGDGGYGGIGPAEICDNGVDDDGDGLVDCADEACPGVSCLETVPDTWEGPLVVRLGPNQDEKQCEGAWDVVAYAGASVYAAEPAECASCSCGSLQNASCGPVTVSYYPQSNCAGSPDLTQVSTQASGCQTFLSSHQLSASVSTSAGSGGFCAPQGGGVQSLPTITRNSVTVCRQSEPTCSGGCAPAVPADFESVACIGKEGEQTCPQGFGQPIVVYRVLWDTRACTSCSCGSPTVTCDGSVEIHDGSTCGTGYETIAYGTCAEATNDPDAFRDITPPPSGSCAATGGDPMGDLIPQDPVTICCPP